jgi:hypothetical protein
MNTDDVISCLYQARSELFEAKAAAAAAGIDRDFDGLINQVEILTYVIMTDQRDL